MAQWVKNPNAAAQGTVEAHVGSLTWHSGLRIWCCRSCSSDQSLAWTLPCAGGVAIKLKTNNPSKIPTSLKVISVLAESAFEGQILPEAES